MKGLLATFALLLVAGLAHAIEVREAHYVMGTTLEITLEAPDRLTGQRWIRAGITEARRLDAELTSWDVQSSLSRLNAAAGKGVQRVSSDLFSVVSHADRLSRATRGTFDVSVGPLLFLWRNAAIHNSWPTAEGVFRSRKRVGYEKITFYPPHGIALREGMSLQLGGIGKGYAADRITYLFRGQGVKQALVNFGGSSMVAIGAPEGANAWLVWVQVGDRLEGPISLRDRALSTSGSLARVLRIDGRVRGDIIDPRDGHPIGASRMGMVLGPSATDAEAWSTALVVAPETTLAALHEHPDYEARLIGSSYGKFSE